LELQANLALARLGAADEDTLESLCSFVTRPDCTYLAAALVQVAAPARSVAHIQALLGAGAAPAAIASIEASGDPFWVPSLIRLMSDQRVGHLAGEALSFITGVDLESADLAREAGRAVDDDADACADVWLAQESRLVRPSELAVARWWKQHAHQFTAGLRYLGGQVLGRVEQPPFDSEHVATLRSLVRTARSRQRSMAAHWLALSAPGKSSVNTLAFSVTPHVLPGWEPAQQDAPLTTIHARQSEGV
jgi:hypothetical protein